MRQLATFALLLTLACGSDDDGVDPPQACRDAADAFGDMCVRCALDTYQACYDGLVQGSADGDCDNVTSIRDEGELYGACFAYIQTVACATVAAPGFTLPDYCKMQLRH